MIPSGRPFFKMSGSGNDFVVVDEPLRGTWRVSKPGGLLFCRLASRVDGQPTDPSHTYHVTAGHLLSLTRELGGELAENLKTSLVDGLRCMTTWVVRKNPTAL